MKSNGGMLMSGRLSNRVCIVTGSGGSIGRAAAQIFAGEGAQVIGCDMNAAAAEETSRLILSTGGNIMSLHPCDLTYPEQCRQLVETTENNFGRVDVLFNNAAMAYFGWIEELPESDWHRTINEELNLVYQLTRACWPVMRRTGGSIINTASASAWLAFRALPGLAHSAAKGAVLAMTRQLAMEGAPHGIRVNSISPGLISTNQTREFLKDPQWSEPMLNKIMLGRLGEPEEVAAAALFLASTESSFVTGTDIRVDGGTTAW